MDVRIGVSQTAKEILVELPDDTDQDKLVAEVEAALAKETGMLWLTERRGRQLGVPVSKLAYLEVGHPSQDRVGFAR